MDTKDISDGYHTFEELYEHRYALFVALTKCMPDVSWRATYREDGSMYPGAFVAGMELPTGQITYHLPVRYWDMMEHVETLEQAPPWDGHNAGHVAERLRAFSVAPAAPKRSHHRKQVPVETEADEPSRSEAQGTPAT